jgi:hypothetical protein
MIHEFRKSSVQMGEDFSTAFEEQVWTNVVAPGLAQCTCFACQSNFQCDPIIHLQICDFGPNSNDDAGGFMAQTEWLTNNEFAIAAIRVVM